MRTIIPGQLPPAELHQFLLGSVSPRPIAFVSTCDAAGNVNLAPFSFFNCFGSNPPIIVFSPARSGRSGLTKHTLDNVKETMQCVVNMVNYDMVGKMNIASADYPKGVNEFEKAGFTELASDFVKAPRVKESPAQLECQVKQIIETGEKGGAGNLIIAEVLCIHIDEQVLDAAGKMDPRKMDLVARMGGSWYVRANGEALFQLPQPVGRLCIGIDALPDFLKQADWLSANQLSLLGSLEHLPDSQSVDVLSTSGEFSSCRNDSEAFSNIKKKILELLSAAKPEEALLWAMAFKN